MGNTLRHDLSTGLTERIDCVGGEIVRWTKWDDDRSIRAVMNLGSLLVFG